MPSKLVRMVSGSLRKAGMRLRSAAVEFFGPRDRGVAAGAPLGAPDGRFGQGVFADGGVVVDRSDEKRAYAQAHGIPLPEERRSPGCELK